MLRWYSPDTGRYTRTDPLGLYEGPNLYSYADLKPLVVIDPLGLAVYVCSRKAFESLGGIGNHAYVWDDRPGTPDDQRFCGVGKSRSEDGPGTDACNYVPGSDGREDQIMGCCRLFRDNAGPYIPFLNDCQTGIKRALRCGGVENPGIPGGRLGLPCDECSIAPEPPVPPVPPFPDLPPTNFFNQPRPRPGLL